MNRQIKMITTISILSVLFVLTAWMFVQNQHSPHPNLAYAATETPSSSDTHSISVQGQGQVLVTPDVAYITMGVQTQAKTAKEAQAQNADAFDHVRTGLKQNFQLSDQDIKTVNYSIYPTYSYANGEQTITGYTATQTIQITYHQLKQIGQLIDSATNAGINRVQTIQFDTDKRQQYELEAIQNAMDNAKAKASTIAKSTGQPLKGVLQVSQSSSSPVPIPYYAGVAKMDTSAQSTSISVGQLKITASVNVKYAF